MPTEEKYDWANDPNRKLYFVCVDCGAKLLERKSAAVKDESQLRCHKHWLENSKETV